jgi:hypothetical protein
MTRRPNTKRILEIFLLLVIGVLWLFLRRPAPTGDIEQAFRDRHSDVIVQDEGIIERVLPDDLEGSRHQRFIVRLPSRHTVLVSHNIDLAPRIDGLAAGEPVSFRGEYEWNDAGGVIHWTHDDPRGRHEAGWIRYGNRVYH